MHDDIRVKIGTSVIKETKEQMLLEINIDNKLTFKSHVETLCKKAAQKLHALARIANYTETEQLASSMNAFIVSNFSYCPLVWMFHDRNMNKKINKIQVLDSVFLRPNLKREEQIKLKLTTLTFSLGVTNGSEGFKNNSANTSQQN